MQQQYVLIYLEMKKDFSKHILYNHYDWHTWLSPS